MLVVAAMAVALMAIGCGSDSGDETTSQAQAGNAAETQSDGGSEGQTQDGSEAEDGSETQSGEDGESSAGDSGFVKEASAACTNAREGSFEKIDAYRKKFKPEGLSEADLTNKAVKTVLLETIEGEIAGIQSLAPEAEDPAEIEKLVAEMEATFKQAQVKAKTDAGYAEIEDLFDDTDKTLESLGLSACSKSA